MVAIIDLHWTAGFLEGEGCFTALNNHPKNANGRASYWVPLIDASQVNKEPVERLRKIFGGQLTLVKAKPPRQQYWVWRVHGKRAIGLMLTLWTLMSERRRGQIELAISRWKINTNLSREEMLFRKPRGEKNGNSKLTEETVRLIYASAESNKALASRFSVSAATIHNVRHGKIWAHVNRAVA